MGDFINLPIPEIDADGLGPPLGQRFPDVVLPDQSGNLVDLHQHRAGRRGLFIVHRSADW